MSQGPFPPPPGAYPPAPQWAPPPQKRSGGVKFVAVGCSVMLAAGICAGAVGFSVARKALTGGSEVATQPFSSGAPFQFEARSNGRELRVWLDVDAQHTDGFPLQGSMAVAANGAPVRQATINGSLGGGCTNPAMGEGSSICLNWRSTSFNGQGSVSGRTRLFTVPASAQGTVMTFAGTIIAGSGTTIRSARILVTD